MSIKSFCDICENETKGGEEIKIWSHPMKAYCLNCWMDKKNWSIIHSDPSQADKKN